MKKIMVCSLLGFSLTFLAPAVLVTVIVTIVGGGAGALGWGSPLPGTTESAAVGSCAQFALQSPLGTAEGEAVQYAAGGLAEQSCGGGWPGWGGARGAAAESFAVSQIGTPYQWGGEKQGVGFDCSGLAQAAWQAAGVRIPRVAQDQFYAGPMVPPVDQLEPGDLVFFGSGPSDVTHVGVVVDPSGVMVDAPHTGALVRLDRFPSIEGASWGGEVFVGATRPGGES